MPAFYNPYANAYPFNYSGNMFNPPMQSAIPVQQYMINVDGEAAARAWQIPSAPQPNIIVPLFDTDGQHVYFKSYDAYGRMNPLRKGKIVFEEELPQASGENSAEAVREDYVRTGDFKKLEQEIESLKEMLQKSVNQIKVSSRGEK